MRLEQANVARAPSACL